MYDSIPYHVVVKLVRLDIKRPASWRVLLTIIGEAANQAGSGNLLDDTVARLQIKDIALATNLCERTVKTAVAELVAAGIVVRVGRVGAFAVPMLHLAVPGTARWSGEPSRTGFTAKQAATVRKALREAGLLLGVDPTSIMMPSQYCEQLCLALGITFHAAFLSISRGLDREIARRFVGLVLEFRHSEAVGGTPAHCSGA